jgi:hypothetical protein
MEVNTTFSTDTPTLVYKHTQKLEMTSKTDKQTKQAWNAFLPCCSDEDDDASYIIIRSTSPNSSLLSSFPIKILYAFLISPMNAHPTHLTRIRTQ